MFAGNEWARRDEGNACFWSEDLQNLENARTPGSYYGELKKKQIEKSYILQILDFSRAQHTSGVDVKVMQTTDHCCSLTFHGPCCALMLPIIQKNCTANKSGTLQEFGSFTKQMAASTENHAGSHAESLMWVNKSKDTTTSRPEWIRSSPEMISAFQGILYPQTTPEQEPRSSHSSPLNIPKSLLSFPQS